MKTQKIIIADNNKYFREGLKAILQNISNSDEITEANGGVQLLDIMNTETVDIIFLEIVLNGIDGVEVTRKIKTLILIQDYSFFIIGKQRYISKMVGAGANGYLYRSCEITKHSNIYWKTEKVQFSCLTYLLAVMSNLETS